MHKSAINKNLKIQSAYEYRIPESVALDVEQTALPLCAQLSQRSCVLNYGSLIYGYCTVYCSTTARAPRVDFAMCIEPLARGGRAFPAISVEPRGMLKWEPLQNNERLCSKADKCHVYDATLPSARAES